jgi:hypothetical protein
MSRLKGERTKWMITTIIFDTTPEVKQNIYMIVSQLNNAMMGSNENRDTLDEAMFRSWKNQKKEYQNENQRLPNEVSSYCEKLDKIQSKLLSGDMNARGCNSVNKQEYDRYDHCNADIVSGFCKSRMFPQYKFLEPSYMIFSLEIQRSLCYKINKMIEKLLGITSDLDHEYY